ncbi:tail fiber assembly protein [Buttiauxella noackiae ATCC 51607]|uniref:Tail fiber assembly protein n=1 Tax=Buttiauxella noackiae ATCC 51607 TaxID=1354255 RepID=A0A1B7HTB5_9ENTR|nr:tail fiber assembly protein [Buttiauxella noackiae]OAT18855.1 tail fiber assembly protein [Buttiauxella noackiae ATCC 51607]
MTLIELKRYYPEEMPLGNGVQYFIDVNGKDWFKSLPLFTKKYSIAFEPASGVIRSYCDDVSRLYPVDLNVTDVDTLPDGFDIDGTWIFDEGVISQRVLSSEELTAQAGNKKQMLMNEANTAIAVLQDAVELNIATESEAALLRVWKNYRVLLSRIDVTQTDGIEWPQPPVTD